MTRPITDTLRCELPIQLAPMGSVSASPALPLAVSVPVVAAGGIATPRDVAAALAAGAAAVRVGTRFIVARESDAHPAWKRAIIAARAEDAVVSTAFNAGMPVPGPHRVLRSSIAAAEALGDEQAGVVRLGGSEIRVARFAPTPPTAGSTGAIEAMPFYAGESAGAVTAIQPAGEIVADLAAGLVRGAPPRP